MPSPKRAAAWRPNLEVHEWFFGLFAEWARKLGDEASPAEATRALVRLHAGSIREDPQRSIFWMMLAFYQCRDDCLQPLVRRRALEAIRRGPENMLWLNGSASTSARRRKDYERLRTLIEAMPRARTRRTRGR